MVLTLTMFVYLQRVMKDTLAPTVSHGVTASTASHVTGSTEIAHARLATGESAVTKVRWCLTRCCVSDCCS